jgi:DNA-binding CsgD family transcriptional regulator/tetratricopeptide (TPR) repeat protein
VGAALTSDGRGMTARLTSSRLIGRRGDLAELEAALDDAAAGRPALAFVAGESGVGKTRLLAEFTQRARDRGALVLVGDAVDFGGDGELPYLPLVAALRPLARSGDPALTEPVREAIGPLLPQLEPSAPDPAKGAEPGSQARLFEGLLSLLDALGQERPVLLVIEDLHWADRSTRAALAFLAGSLSDERAVVVGSYRPDELLRSHPLRSLLAELERAPRARRVTLAPLTRDELAEQLADILGAPPTDELLARLWARSGGNPLFSEELLAAGVDGRGGAPRTLRDALMLRVERLSEAARDLLGLMAVGQRLDHELIEETSGLERRAVRDALREAVDRHIVVVHDDGTYRFRHALLRELVEDDLLPGERRQLHATLARALEGRLDDGAGAQHAAAVAYHFDAAGEQATALAATVRAATAAERAHAYGEAAALLERALELWDRASDPEARAGVDRVTLLTRAGDAAGALGDPGRQLTLLEAAFAGLGPQPDPRRAARILESSARAQRHLNRARSSIATLERGLALVERSDPSCRAELLAGLARARMLVADFGEAIRLGRQALDVATGEDLPVVEGQARNTLGYSLAMTGDVAEGAAELRAAIWIAREQDNMSDLGEAYNNYSEMLHLLGRSDEARAVALEARQAVARRKPVAVTWLDVGLAEIAYDVGEWELAEASLPTAQRWTGTQTRVHIALRRVLLAVGRGDHAAAVALLDELEPMGAESTEPRTLAGLGVAIGELHRRAGDLAAASAAVDRWLERIERCGDDAISVSALAGAGVTVAADAAERARDRDDGEAASSALRRVDELLARVALAATETRPVERAALESARAEAGRAAGRPDPAQYARAAAVWEELGRPEPAARMRWRQAEARAAAGDRDAAVEPARAAHATALRLGAGWLRGEIEGLAARARFTLEPDGSDHDAPEPAEEDAFGLTPRELQVLALLAEGATNREIGATLFMSQKTASVHVSRILSKLNARSRTEAAAVAHRHRLVT